ncbi:DUF58 domain-containing protein [Thiomicrorhabdus sp. Milos-T2]|uniref:DUF58 domain-containing protein n=1 Tax=Thiomicrorhabdus sp. Milos-T2 TaxID=90814 RepID=UPI0004944EA9|nr:DUF58 domain-containing protein [Thiomicrorhabdus sp. Milos-T2]
MSDKSQQSDSLYSELPDLVAFRFHVKQKKLNHQQNLLAANSGDHLAIRKGRGMTFSEVRQYQPGDDIRHIDWRVTARTQKTHTKVFVEEHERPTLLVTEQTPHLFFGSKVRLKTAQALNLSAVLAWVSLNHNERVGGITFNHLQTLWIPPRRSPKTVLHLLQKGIELQHQINRPMAPDTQAWVDTLTQLIKVNKPGNKVFLIGDMMQLVKHAAPQLHKLKHNTDITAIHIYDNLERELPKLGWLSMTQSFVGDKLIKLDSFRAKTRDSYSTLYKEQWHETQELFSKLKIPLVEIGTHQEPLMALIQHKLIQ